MLKCRLCLVNSKNVKCLFDLDNNLGISYADIVNSFVNVKVSKCDGITDRICLACRRKTKEFWAFKLKVERSYMALQDNCPLKRVHFTNIYNIEFSKVIENVEKKPKPLHTDFTTNLLKNNYDQVIYNDIVIKKVARDMKESLSVLEFLNSIKDENENDYQDEYSCEVEIDNDPDYKVHQPPKKKIKSQFKEDKENNKCVLQNPIKPVFLADYSLVPNKTQRKRKIKETLRICPYCGKTYNYRYLKGHLLIHSDKKPFQCGKCSKAFVSKESLKAHMKQCHGSKDFKCDQCVAGFTTKHGLMTHVLNRHRSEKNYICDVCNKTWTTKYKLLRHIQCVHYLGPKPFKCEQCPDMFNSRYVLKHHMRVHTKERPYNCEMCSQPYSYKHDFNRHCFKKHAVWFYRRTVHVMNEQVLAQERVLMRDLVLRLDGILQDDRPVNPFEGPQAAMAFDLMVKAIQSGKLVVDLQL